MYQTAVKISLVALALCVGVESVSYKTQLYWKDLQSSLSLFELVAVGYGSGDKNNLILSKVEFEKLTNSLKLLAALDEETVDLLSTRAPRVSAFRKALVNVYSSFPEETIEKEVASVVSKLIYAFTDLRTEIHSQGHDNLKTIKKLVTGNLIETLYKPDSLYAVPLTRELVRMAQDEYITFEREPIDLEASDLVALEKIEKSALYLGTVAVDVLNSSVFPLAIKGKYEMLPSAFRKACETMNCRNYDLLTTPVQVNFVTLMVAKVNLNSVVYENIDESFAINAVRVRDLLA